MLTLARLVWRSRERKSQENTWSGNWCRTTLSWLALFRLGSPPLLHQWKHPRTHCKHSWHVRWVGSLRSACVTHNQLQNDFAQRFFWPHKDSSDPNVPHYYCISFTAPNTVATGLVMRLHPVTLLTACTKGCSLPFLAASGQRLAGVEMVPSMK